MLDRKPNWTVVKTFEKDGILVEVSKSDTQTPRYNVRTGRQGDNGLIPFLQLYVERGTPVRVRPIADNVADLIEEAEKWVTEEAQKHENAFQAARRNDTAPRGGRPGEPRDGGKQHKRPWRDRDRGEHE